MKVSDFPRLKCDGIVIHWSAGHYDNYYPDRYNACIAGPPQDGLLVPGVPFEHNLRKIQQGMPYAAHTRGRNSYRLGFSVMACYGVDSNNWQRQVYEASDEPPTARQIEALCALTALAVVAYQPPNLESFVRTHAAWAIHDGYFPNRWDFWHWEQRLWGKIRYYADHYTEIES